MTIHIPEFTMGVITTLLAEFALIIFYVIKVSIKSYKENKRKQSGGSK